MFHFFASHVSGDICAANEENDEMQFFCMDDLPDMVLEHKMFIESYQWDSFYHVGVEDVDMQLAIGDANE